MKARPFSYARPSSLEEAQRIYRNAAGEACFIAGGQSLIPALSMRLRAPDLLIDLSRIEALRGIGVLDGVLHLGALTRHAEILADPLVAAHAPLLRDAAAFVAHPAIRNRGTLGGSLALADPASEFPAMMLALDATIEIEGPAGRRLVPVDDYFKALYETALEPGELVTGVRIPVAPPGSCSAFDELARRRGDYAIVGVGIQARLSGGIVVAVRIAFLSVGPTPVRAKRAEAALRGHCLDRETIAAAQAAVVDDLEPSDDVHVSAAMRMHLARVLLGRVAGRLQASVA